MSLTRTTAPAAKAVQLEEAKEQVSIESQDDDTLVSRLVDAATDQVERHCGLALITQTWQLKVDSLAECIRLPKPPLQSISSIAYVDSDGVEQTLATTEYQVILSKPAEVVRAYSKSYPATRPQREAVTITMVCGYGGSYSDVPESIRHAILMLVGEWDEHREGLAYGATKAIPNSVEYLLRGHRIGGLFVGAGNRQW